MLGRSSGSSAASSTVVVSVSEVLWSCRNFGSFNQVESLRREAFTDRVARSAGLRSVATYFHWSSDEDFLICCTRLPTYT